MPVYVEKPLCISTGGQRRDSGPLRSNPCRLQPEVHPGYRLVVTAVRWNARTARQRGVLVREPSSHWRPEVHYGYLLAQRKLGGVSFTMRSTRSIRTVVLRIADPPRRHRRVDASDHSKSTSRTPYGRFSPRPRACRLIDLDYLSRRYRRVSKSSARMQPLDSTGLRGDRDRDRSRSPIHPIDTSVDPTYVSAAEQFLAMVEGGRNQSATGLDGIRSIELVEAVKAASVRAVWRSSRRGMGSTRLPGKVLMSLGPMSVPQLLVRRLRPSQVDRYRHRDQRPTARRCDRRRREWSRVPCVRGSERDVLARYRDALEENIRRPRWSSSDRRLSSCGSGRRRHRTRGDTRRPDPTIARTPWYVRSRRARCRGLSGAALGEAYLEATDPADREHVTPFSIAGLGDFGSFRSPAATRGSGESVGHSTQRTTRTPPSICLGVCPVRAGRHDFLAVAGRVAEFERIDVILNWISPTR